MKTSLVTGLLAALTASAHGALHPAFPIQTCTKAGCTTESTSVVLDGKDFSNVTDASQYPANGVDISGNVMKLTLTDGSGPRVYLAATDDKYKMFKMAGKELSYDIDTSQLDCSMNGALYFVQMPETGAAKGAGYCDANGVGGSWCEEMDIWEANRYATVMTVHPTAHDNSGCGLNPYRRGHKTLYGYGSSFSLDTSKKFTVVTQFLDDSSGMVTEMRRMYIQNGNVVQSGSMKQTQCNVNDMGKVMKDGSVMAISVWWSGGMGWLDSGDAGPCPQGTTGKNAVVTFSDLRFGDIGTTVKGSDSTPPPDPTTPIKLWGKCGGQEYEGSSTCAEGVCTEVNQWVWECRSNGQPTTAPTTPTPTPTPSSSGTTPKPTPAPTTPNPTPAPSGSVPRWGQCGGINYSGPTQCAEGTCKHLNDYYYQCV